MVASGFSAPHARRKPQATDPATGKATDMKNADGFRIPDRDEERAARILGVSIAILFGLILVLKAISW
jgi:hypothetical protein